ncbi:Uncharacterised protein [Citrobacter koseri]|uniref:Uncharacterized protein n=1 Tax=Citrobacter koseri TaxID=545 RepID=A0A3S5DNN2_CITKO|nr:Uncharacterised protein [Citrobacter koseri]
MSFTSYRYYWAMWSAVVVLAGLMLLSIAKGAVSLSLLQVLGGDRDCRCAGIGYGQQNCD